MMPSLGRVLVTALSLGLLASGAGAGCSSQERDFASSAAGEAGMPIGAGATHGGAAASGGEPAVGGAAGAESPVGALGTLGESCSEDGDNACAGHAQAKQLLCVNGHWASNGSCAPGSYCNTAPGDQAGLCAPIVEECRGKEPGDTACAERDRVECGPDLLAIAVLETCAGQCVEGACTCEPDTVRCAPDGVTLETCTGAGTWGDGVVCQEQACPFGKVACQGECTPGSTECVEAQIALRACDAQGSWQEPVSCVEQACPAGQTACQGECTPGTKHCNGNGVQLCDGNGELGAVTACAAATPHCSAGICSKPPSCKAVADTCGANQDENCCSSPLVPGGTFNRGNDPKYPASVSAFRLDSYEVTVARVRQFVAEYSQKMTPAGAGKNPNDPSDPGWQTVWNQLLPSTAASFTGHINASSEYSTWTGDDRRPLNNLGWHLAYAYCIWDGGRLPSEAEWNYAAAGGSEQRLYAWGSQAPAMNTLLAVHNCFFDPTPACSSTSGEIAPVGSAVAGNGKWGHADLAGNLAEWTLDAFVQGESYPLPCSDCTRRVEADPSHILRGGGYGSGAEQVTTSARSALGATATFFSVGVRCARAP